MKSFIETSRDGAKFKTGMTFGFALGMFTIALMFGVGGMTFDSLLPTTIITGLFVGSIPLINYIIFKKRDKQ